ncbi:MAG: phosphate ABC transporter ATP-binding protein PstB [Candidatus Omnitrophica bacterium]|nr:phosphate ABC transporter ATP-binding protein PstB [Candidatus Omnitrophota bacterium]
MTTATIEKSVPRKRLAINSPAITAPAASRLEALTPSDWALDVRDLSVYFGTNRVLKDVSLQVRNRSVTAIIGPSGCGKSTFLRAMNRMHDLVPEARVTGAVRLFGSSIYGPEADAVAVRRRVGMVFQKSNPFPTLSIVDNVKVGPRLGGVRQRSVLDERAERSLRLAALWDEVKDRLNAPAVSLSGGQQQRLCIARALAVEPEVLLMDEPASALDPIATARIEELILNLKKDLTIVIVTHNLQQAARISDYTAFFYLGELVEYDTTSKIFTGPARQKTEDYVTGRFG